MAAKKKDRRKPDQDAAVASAFVAGALPEEDRRSPAEQEAENIATFSDDPGLGYEAVPVQSVQVIPSDAEILASAGLGSVFEKVAHGWKVRYVDGGTVIVCEGPSIGAAVASHGQMVQHPVRRQGNRA